MNLAIIFDRWKLRLQNPEFDPLGVDLEYIAYSLDIMYCCYSRH